MEVVIASEAKQSRAACATLDCFVASLLAMTRVTSFLFPRRQAKARQRRLAAEAGEARQIGQTAAQAGGKILRQVRQTAGHATRHLFRERLELLGRGHAATAAKPHRLGDA